MADRHRVWIQNKEARRTKDSHVNVREVPGKFRGNANLKFKTLEKVSISIFVTNIPWKATTREVWEACAKWGTVIDVYISLKRSKIGARFGFVRFKNVSKVEELISNIRTTWMGNFHLYADHTRFSRYHQSIGSTYNTHVNFKDREANMPSDNIKFMGKGGNSYADVLSGKKPEVTKSTIVVKKSVVIKEDECLDWKKIKHSSLAKINDVKMMHKLFSIFKSEGFVDFDIRYIGGKWVWLEFPSEDVLIKCKQCSALQPFFSEFKAIDGDFIPEDRMVWVDLVGVPLAAWTPTAFKKIASLWGESIFVELDGNESMAHAKVCVLTSHMAKITEDIMVMVNDQMFDFCVNEFASWTPQFEQEEEDSSQYDSTSTNSVSDFNEEMKEQIYEPEKNNVDLDQDDPFGLMDIIEKECQKEKEKEEVVNYVEMENTGSSNESQSQNENGKEGDNKELNRESIPQFLLDLEQEIIEICRATPIIEDEKFLQISTGSTSYSKPPGFRVFATQVDDAKQSMMGTKHCYSSTSTAISVGQTGSLVSDLSRVIQLGNVIGLDMSGAEGDLQKLIIRMSGNLVK